MKEATFNKSTSPPLLIHPQLPSSPHTPPDLPQTTPLPIFSSYTPRPPSNNPSSHLLLIHPQTSLKQPHFPSSPHTPPDLLKQSQFPSSPHTPPDLPQTTPVPIFSSYTPRPPSNNPSSHLLLKSPDLPQTTPHQSKSAIPTC